MNTDTAVETEVVVVPEKSKGQLFKEKYGYSKTMKRNMLKNKCSSIEEYRALRRAKRLKAKENKPIKNKPVKK